MVSGRKYFNDERDLFPPEKLVNHFEHAVVSVSGGKDSIAMMLWALKHWRGSPDKLHFVCAIAPVEWPDMLEYLCYLEKQIGFPITILKDSYDPTLWLSGIKKYGLPTIFNSWCTDVFKIAPISRYIASLGGSKKCISLQGIRAEESLSRFERSPQGIQKGSPYCYPIFYLSTTEVLKIIEKAGIKLHHAYAVQTRFSCPSCPKASFSALLSLKLFYPHLWDAFLWFIAVSVEADKWRNNVIFKKLLQRVLRPRADLEKLIREKALVRSTEKVWYPANIRPCELKYDWMGKYEQSWSLGL